MESILFDMKTICLSSNPSLINYYLIKKKRILLRKMVFYIYFRIDCIRQNEMRYLTLIYENNIIVICEREIYRKKYSEICKLKKQISFSDFKLPIQYLNKLGRKSF